MINKLAKLFFKKNNHQEDQDINMLTRVASVALLIEMCKADNNIDPKEINLIIKIAKKNFNISDYEAELLIEQATEENKNSISLYEFTNLINQKFERKNKYILIRNIWEVAYSDNLIDPHEEYLIRKISDLIYVSHNDFIKAKFEAKNLQDL